MLDIGLLHLAEELARVRRQGLDITALAFCVDGVKCQARLTRPRYPSEHDEFVARDLDVDTLEVVLVGTANDDVILRDIEARFYFRGELGKRVAEAEARAEANEEPKIVRQAKARAVATLTGAVLRLVWG